LRKTIQSRIIKTTQELLRHANPNITMGIYQQAVSEEKRAAQHLAFSALFSGGCPIEPFGIPGGCLKDVDIAVNH
jgi:hypothetical protein